MSLFDKFENAKGKAQQAAQKYGFSPPPTQRGRHSGHPLPPGSNPWGHPAPGVDVHGHEEYSCGQNGPTNFGPGGSPQGHQQQGPPPSPPYTSGGGGLASNFQLPHVLRQGIAQFDPRLNANRAFYMYNSALKGVPIDFVALNREQHKAAQASYEYGQEHIAARRIDGVGDEVLVDMLDRFAYTSAMQGDIYQAHAEALEEIRKQQKHAWLAAPAESDEVLQARIRRTFLHRQIKELRPQAEKQPSSPQARKFRETEDELAKVEHDMGPKEIEAAYAKRSLVRTYYEARGDQLMRLGAQLVELGRHEKLLAGQIPQADQSRLTDPVLFPAEREEKDRSTQPAWSGAVLVSEVFAAIKPAIDAARRTKVDQPQIPAGGLVHAPTRGTQVSATTGNATPQASGVIMEDGHRTESVAAAVQGASGNAGAPNADQSHVSFAPLPTKLSVESGLPPPPVPIATTEQPGRGSVPAALQPSVSPEPALPYPHPDAPPLPTSHPPGAATSASIGGVDAQAPLTDEPELEEFHDAHESHESSPEERAWTTPIRRGTEEYGNTGFNPFTANTPVAAQSLSLNNPWADNTSGTGERAPASATSVHQQATSAPSVAHSLDTVELQAQAARDSKEREVQLQAGRAQIEGEGGNGAPPPYQS